MNRPILFSAAMVGAILAGRKTQTRRAVKVRGGLDYVGPGQDAYDPADPANYGFEDGYGDFHLLDQALPAPGMLGGPPYRIGCPYGVPRLWVQEGYRIFQHDPETRRVAVEYLADGMARDAVLTPAEHDKLLARKTSPDRNTPGRFLYRSCSRLTLDVLSVRVERLHDISEEDAKAEGVEPKAVLCDGPAGTHPILSHKHAFADLWRSINGPESWDANPWVWRIEFSRSEVPHAR